MRQSGTYRGTGFEVPRCRKCPEGGVYYWLHRSYRIVYRVSEENRRVEVMRFWHCSRDDLPPIEESLPG